MSNLTTNQIEEACRRMTTRASESANVSCRAKDGDPAALFLVQHEAERLGIIPHVKTEADGKFAAWLAAHS